MSQIPSQTWPRESFRHTVAPVSTRIAHILWLVIQRVREIFILRVNILAKPWVSLQVIRTNVKAAAIAGVIVFLYSMLMKAGSITTILENITTQRLLASVVAAQSGYARSVDHSLVPLNDTLQTVGDDVQDQQVKLFLTFNFSSIPESAKITNAQLTFQCALAGDISGFGDLSLHLVEFNGYSETVFDSFPPANKDNFRARIYFEDNLPLRTQCNTNQPIAFSNAGLAQMVASRLRDGKINLVLYFAEDSVLPNRRADGIKMVTPPQLQVSFIP